MNTPLFRSSLWLVGMSLAAAVFLAEHLWLAVRVGHGKEKIARIRALIALFVPLAAPILAWRAGVRARLFVYFTTFVVYLCLRLLG